MINICSGILLTTQVTACIFISCSFFQIDNTAHNLDLTNLPTMISVGMLGISTVYPCCYFGSRVTSQLNQMAGVIYFSTWYTLPMEQRKYTPFMIAFAHRDHTLRCMNMMTCSLESFVQVTRIVRFHL